MLVSEFDLDWKATTDEILVFLRDIVKRAGAKGCVIGLSGGVDSSLVAKLLVMALGKEKVLGILMPTEFTPKNDIADAQWLAEDLQIRFELVEIQSSVNAMTRALSTREESAISKIPIANIRSRMRMIILYYFANLNSYLVAGTGDRSEDLIGYFTKYGDGGVDFLPISHLYKTQVRKLAQHLGIPARIALKPSSPQLYPGHQATDEIPLDYDILDRVLKMLIDELRTPEEVAGVTGVRFEVVKEVMRRFHDSEHKRNYPFMVHKW